MSNIAQTVNVLQAMVLTEPGAGRMLVTPTGHVYAMYARHQNGKSVRVLVETPDVSYAAGKASGSLPVISGSASLKDGELFLTLTNSHASDTVDVEINLLGGACAESATAQVMAGKIHAHNTFDAPESIQPGDFPVAVRGATVHISLPAACVASVSMNLIGG